MIFKIMQHEMQHEFNIKIRSVRDKILLAFCAFDYNTCNEIIARFKHVQTKFEHVTIYPYFLKRFRFMIEIDFEIFKYIIISNLNTILNKKQNIIS